MTAAAVEVVAAVATVPKSTSSTKGIWRSVDRWQRGLVRVVVVEIGVWRRAAEGWRLRRVWRVWIVRGRLMRILRSILRVLRARRRIVAVILASRPIHLRAELQRFQLNLTVTGNKRGSRKHRVQLMQQHEKEKEAQAVQLRIDPLELAREAQPA